MPTVATGRRQRAAVLRLLLLSWLRGSCVVSEGVSAAQRLRRFLELMLASPDHLLDVRRLAAGADGGGGAGRVDDITGVLEEIRLIQKQSAHSFKWM